MIGIDIKFDTATESAYQLLVYAVYPKVALIDNTGIHQYWWGAIGATVYYSSLNGDYTIPGPSVGGNGGHYGAHRVNLHVSVGDIAFKCR